MWWRRVEAGGGVEAILVERGDDGRCLLSSLFSLCLSLVVTQVTSSTCRTIVLYPLLEGGR